MTNRELIIKDIVNTLFTMDGEDLVDMFCNTHRGCYGCPFECVNCPAGATREYSREWLKRECEVKND